jgi:hypothetical protein
VILASLFGLSGKQWGTALMLFAGLLGLMVGIWSVRKGTVPCQFGFEKRVNAPFLFWVSVVMWFGSGAVCVLCAIYLLIFPN